MTLILSLRLSTVEVFATSSVQLIEACLRVMLMELIPSELEGIQSICLQVFSEKTVESLSASR